MAAKRSIADDQHYTHFITFSTYRNRRLLDHDHPKRIILGVLNYVLEKHSAKCVGFVLMPDHIHALIWFPKTDHLSPFMHEWKRQSSLRVRKWYREHAPNYAKDFDAGDRFWQPKYYSFSIYEQRKLKEKLEYLHLNPVRAGLVETAADWPWSSARWYYWQRSVGVPLQWVE